MRSSSPSLRGLAVVIGIVQLFAVGAVVARASADEQPGVVTVLPSVTASTTDARSSSSTTTTAAPTTTAPPTTAAPTTVAPTSAPPTTVAPAPTPPPTTAPAPAPAAPPTAPAPTAEQRAHAAFVEAVPARWRDAINPRIEIIEGSTSWALTSNVLQIGRTHAESRWSHLLSVVAHEFGHLIAFARGSQAYLGAPPEGWPDPQHGEPAEAWADCVSLAFTGVVDPSYGMPACPRATLDWTAAWLAGN